MTLLKGICLVVCIIFLSNLAIAQEAGQPPPTETAAASPQATGADAGAKVASAGDGGESKDSPNLADDDDDDILDDYLNNDIYDDDGNQDDLVPPELRKEMEAKEAEHVLERKVKWDVVLVANMGERSKSDGETWTSKLKHIIVEVEFDPISPSLSRVCLEDKKKPPALIRSELNERGLGMDLSELLEYNGKLVACDEATGVVYIIPTKPKKKKGGNGTVSEIEPRPWVTLWDGDGTHTKAFSCKWMTQKDGILFVGGNGKLREGENNQTETDAQYIKQVSPNGEVSHVNWMNKYAKVAAYSGVWYPGYVSHEAVGFSHFLGSWVFLPRKVSREAFDKAKDEEQGANSMIVTDEKFKMYTPIKIGTLNLNAGFSSFKWVPGTEDQIVVALKTETKGGAVATYVIVFDMAGAILLPETKVADEIYEGIAFLKPLLSDSDRRALKKWKTNKRKKPSHKYSDPRVLAQSYDYDPSLY